MTNRVGLLLHLAALALAALVVCAVGLEFDAAARRESPRGAAAGFPLDDAWIHQVYARSVAAGDGFAYGPPSNPTEFTALSNAPELTEPTAGSTSPLYTVVLAAWRRVVGADDARLGSQTRALGCLLAILLVIAASRLPRALKSPAAISSSAAAAIVLALDSDLVFGAMSGMEVPLFAALALFALERLLAARFLAAGILAGLALLTRPEGAVLAALWFVLAPFVPSREQAIPEDGDERRRNAPRRPLLAMVAFGLPVALAGAAFAALSHAASGRLLPNTFHAKAQTLDPGVAIGQIGGILKELAGASSLVIPTGYVLLAVGLVGIFARAGTVRALAFVLTPIALIVAVAASRPLPAPEAFYWSRYALPAAAFLGIAIALGVGAAIGSAIDVARKRIHDAQEGLAVPPPIVALVLLAISFLVYAPAPEQLRAAIARFGKEVRDVDSTNVAAALWLEREAPIPRDAVIAAQDAGAVAYFGSRPVIDLIGLNDDRLTTLGLEGGDIAGYVASRRPQAFFLLDPDAGATDLRALAALLGLSPAKRFAVPDWSLFGAPVDKGVLVLTAGGR
jgi:hypothetical protein